MKNESRYFQKYEDMTIEHIDELALDHPGSKDKEYRKRRNFITIQSKIFRETGIIHDIDYTEEEQSVWQYATKELEEIQTRRASKVYLEAKKTLGISNQQIPQLTEMNFRLKKLSNFRLAPIEGLVETRAFLSRFSSRTMLATQYIRHQSRPEYTPEPDIVHEAMGHIPMFTNLSFADFSQFIGYAALIANDKQLEELGRLYWFTVEFGLIKEDGELKAYGAGLLSSFGELEYAFSSNVERRPFDLRTVINHDFSYSDMQSVLYVIPSYDYLQEVIRKYVGSF